MKKTFQVLSLCLILALAGTLGVYQNASAATTTQPSSKPQTSEKANLTGDYCIVNPGSDIIYGVTFHVTGSDVCLRTDPVTSSTVLRLLQKGEAFIATGYVYRNTPYSYTGYIYGHTTDGWYGCVSAQYLSRN